MALQLREIEIELTPEQRAQITAVTGVSQKALRFSNVQLAALALAARSAGSDCLPMGGSGRTVEVMLRHERECDRAPIRILKLELSEEQVLRIEEETGRRFSAVMVAPDEWTITFSEKWADPGPRTVGGFDVFPGSSGAPPGHRTILLPDRAADHGVFGTGGHPSTRAALLLLERSVPPGAEVLDVGTGTGILAVAAARLGARRVDAIDTDPLARAAARETILLNGIERVINVLDGGMQDLTHAYSLVLANLFPNILISSAPVLFRLVAPGGALIVSGIVRSRADDVRRALAEAGFAPLDEELVEDWTGMRLRRP